MTSDRALLPDPASSSAALILSQLRGIDTWLQALHEAEADVHDAGGREALLDAHRRLSVLQRQHAVIIDRCNAALLTAGTTQWPAVTAVVAHRQAWATTKLVAALIERDVDVLAAVDDGAQAVGVCVAEQPTLLIIGEHLMMQTGEEVARDVGRFSPGTSIARYLDEALGTLLDAGTRPPFDRRLHPADVVTRLLDAVGARRP